MFTRTFILTGLVAATAATAASQDGPEADFLQKGRAEASRPGRAQAPPLLPDADDDFSAGTKNVEEDARTALPPLDGLSIRDLMTAPLVDVEADGRIWARTRDQRATLGLDGFALYPVFGKESPREWPIRFEVAAATRGDTRLGVGVLDAPARAGDRLELARQGLREVYHLSLDGVEQTFVFDAVPGGGDDLVVELAVTTDLRPVVDGEDLRFVHDTLGEVSYGRAFAVDASGTTIEIDRVWTGAGIELRVPAAFVDGAALPLTIDPVINTFTNGYGAPDDRRPDVAWCGQTNDYLVCWEEFTSQQNSDVYVTSWNANGTVQGGTFPIESGSETWRMPRIAYAYGPDRALVVASVDPDHPSGPIGSIRGRLVDVGAYALVGPAFTISTVGSDKLTPDVGGSNEDGLTTVQFCVTWSRQVASDEFDIEYRIVDWDGDLVTSVHSVSDDSDARDITPALSQGLGDVALSGDYWTLAWIRDEDADDRGTVWARRIFWNGNPGIGAGNFVVEEDDDCANPAVTSQFDEPLESGGGRPSIVAYDVLFSEVNHPNGEQRSVYARVVTDGHAHPAVGLNYELEDFDWVLDQWAPSVATDGKGFFAAYMEEHWADLGSVNYNAYVAAGNIVERDGSAYLGLAERHVLVGGGAAGDWYPRLGSAWAGEIAGVYDNVACVWTLSTDADGFGQIRGAVYDHPNESFPQTAAVGNQYCDAAPNSVGTFGGRNSSWLRIQGTPSGPDPYVAVAHDLPTNVFGYLLVSLNEGFVQAPGGSQGNLCLSGSIGRYNQSVGFSGNTGTIATVIDPALLPQPGGAVAAQPGETWHFQLWHRDLDNWVQTSNFTNACRVQFLP